MEIVFAMEWFKKKIATNVFFSSQLRQNCVI